VKAGVMHAGHISWFAANEIAGTRRQFVAP